jgi:transcriptional/translational regulatory protein YebC/TACO1
MAEFHETGYGKRYYEHQVPEITRQLQRIAESLEKILIKIEEADDYSNVTTNIREEDI